MSSLNKQNRKLVPELRFGEFIGNWDKGNISDLINSLDAGVSVNSENRQAISGQKGILKTSCVTNGFFDPSENKVVNHEDEINRLKESVQAETIIISRMNTPSLVGANSYVNSDFPNLFLPDRLWSAKVNKNHLPEWVGILLAHSNTRAVFSARGTGTSGSMKNITKGDVLTTPIYFPKLKEQQKIAKFLTSVDQRISMLKQKKAALETYKKGLMQKIFNQEICFKDKNGHDYPDWEEKRLGDIGEIVSGLTYSPKDINEKGVLVLRSSNIKNNFLKLNDNVYVDVDKFNPVKLNDILICVRNGSKRLIGKNALIDRKSEGMAFGAFMSVFRSKNNRFLIHWFKSRDYQWNVHRNLGATINSINGSDLKKIKLLLASDKEQQQIADCLSSMDQSINKIEKQIEQTTQFKKGLLQKMFV